MVFLVLEQFVRTPHEEKDFPAMFVAEARSLFAITRVTLSFESQDRFDEVQAAAELPKE